mmetsp:Transcript_77367/g.170930  ORF Transcript_77367/g.170930 Transcript_77367/m.170930 type:complete len:230 (-) Transcript_77367:312-1001(-)
MLLLHAGRLGWRRVGELAGSLSLQHASANLASEVVQATWRVWQEQCAVLVGAADVTEHVKVLRDKQQLHDLLAADVGNLVTEVLDTVTQASHNGLALAGKTLALQELGLGLSFGRLHHRHLVGLGLLQRGNTQAAGGVDLVHRVLDSLCGLDIRDQRVNDEEAIRGHALCQLLLDAVGNLFLGLKHLVKVHLRHAGTHSVIYVRRDLLARVSQLVERVIQRLLLHLVLD